MKCQNRLYSELDIAHDRVARNGDLIINMAAAARTMEEPEGNFIIDKIKRVAHKRIGGRNRQIFTQASILVIIRERAEIGSAMAARPTRRIAAATEFINKLIKTADGTPAARILLVVPPEVSVLSLL